MNVLFTAFKGGHNSSCNLIKNFESDKLFLTNSFDGLRKDIVNFDCDDYSSVVMFGLDTELKDNVRIEVCAKNDGKILNTALNVTEISRTFSANGVLNVVSDKTAVSLCNYAYYLMLEKVSGRAIFIHIPPQKFLTEELKKNIIQSL